MKHRTTEESLSVFNVNGSMRKTQKSKLKEKMDRFPLDPSLDESVGIIEMGFLWRLANLTADAKVDNKL